jgi:uncharacterized protein (UPF0276 family)
MSTPTTQEAATYPFLGFGLGLRSEHYSAILESVPAIDWFEVLTENYLVDGGKPLYYLQRILERYPVVMHGVSLSVGSSGALNLAYLQRVKKLADWVKPVWVSDHLCWTAVNGINLHDLLPLPYIEKNIQLVVEHINQVQDYLGRQILIENVSSYLTYRQSEMTEWEFLAEITERSDCYILLDVNNIFVSAFNHDFLAEDYLRGIPRERVKQIHLAGHSHQGNYIIDTHDAPVAQPVWDLYARALHYFGNVSTMIERDDNIPALAELVAEVNQARLIAGAVSSVTPRSSSVLV